LFVTIDIPILPGWNFGTVPNWPKSAAFRLTIHNIRP
jgi:hypothetical protein